MLQVNLLPLKQQGTYGPTLLWTVSFENTALACSSNLKSMYTVYTPWHQYWTTGLLLRPFSVYPTRVLPLSRGSSQWGGVNVTTAPSKWERTALTEVVTDIWILITVMIQPCFGCYGNMLVFMATDVSIVFPYSLCIFLNPPIPKSTAKIGNYRAI